MPTYLVLWKWTDQGARNAGATIDRVQAFRTDVETHGGKLREFMWTLGRWDGFCVVEMSDDQAFTSAMLRLAGAGNVRTESLRAFNSEEMRQIIGKMA
ncbi:MAG: GYD domain-containing protein [Dehalococcoidia bacterium]|jgi:uncharacterized protein with GYD domain|nr:GYD domain-containing protein [Dehalococcoidia bacterium]